MPLFGYSFWDLVDDKTKAEWFGNELEAEQVRDKNEMLEAHQQILQYAKDFMKTDDYLNASPEEQKEFRDYTKQILSEIQPAIRDIDKYNEISATQAETKRRQEIGRNTISEFDRFNAEDGLAAQIEGQALYALTDLGKNAYENTINQAKTVGALGANLFGYKDTAANLADEIMQSQLDMNSMMAPAEFDWENGLLSSQNTRFATNSASQVATLIYSPVNVGISKGIGFLGSKIGAELGITAAAEKFFGAAAGSGAEGIAEASSKLLNINKIPKFFGAGVKQAALDYTQGFVGYALGKTISAAPTWASMSLPELFKDSLEYDEQGNVVLPDSERMFHMAVLAIPHAIIENFGINPQAVGTVAEKLAFKEYMKKWISTTFEEMTEEVSQHWISDIEKEWGKKNPTTGKIQSFADAVTIASQNFTSGDKEKFKELLNEALGGAFGGFAMHPAQSSLATSRYLKMQETYKNSLNKIVQGLDDQANLMEKMGIVSFQNLRDTQNALTEVGKQLQAEEARLKENKFDSEWERRGCIQNIATLNDQAAKLGARLQDAAESTVMDYASGVDILNQMQQDYYAQLESEALKNQSGSDSNVALSIDEAKKAGKFNTQPYQEQINSKIKVYKGNQQLIDEALKERDELEKKDPKLKEQRLAREAEIQKQIDEEKQKGKPKSRTKAELDNLIEEYRNSDFVGNFNDFLRAKDAEEAQAEKDIETEAKSEYDAAFANQQKIHEESEKVADADSQAVEVIQQKIAGVESEINSLMKQKAVNPSLEIDTAIQQKMNERNQLLSELRTSLDKAQQSENNAVNAKQKLENFDKEHKAPEGFRYAKNQNGEVVLEKDPDYKQNNNAADEALKNNQNEAENTDRSSTKIGKETVYNTERDARVAAARMLDNDVKSGKVKQGTRRGDVYSVVKTKYGYVVRQAKQNQTRTKTLNGKDAVDKTKAEQKVAKVNEKLEKNRRKNKKGKKVKVVLVEDQKQIPNSKPKIVRNAFTGVYEKAATYIEGATDQNGNETTIYVVRNNIDSESKLDSIITHELIHAGLRNVLNKKQQSYLLHEVARLLQEDSSFFAKVMPEMEEYSDLLSEQNIIENNGLNVFLEEVLARLAETMDAEEQGISGKIRKIWNNIVGLIYKALRSLGLTTNISKAEIPEILKGLRFNLTGTGSLYHYSRSLYGQDADTKAMFRSDNMKKALEALDKRGDLVYFDIDGKPMFSLRTWEDGGKKALSEWLRAAVKNKELSQNEVKDLLKQMDEIYKTCKIMAAENPDSEFGKWSKVGVDYDSQGKPYFTVVRQNGDYAMNIDFSTVCKKRRALNNVLNEIIKRGYLNKHGDLTKKDVVDIQEAIKNKGFEVACALCFVDAKRYNIGKQAKNIVSKWNKMYKSFQEGTDLYRNTMKELQQRLDDGKKAKTQEQRIAQAISSEEKDADGNYKYRRELTVDWLISSGSREMIGGHDNLAKNYPRIFEVLNGYGSGKSKNSHMDVAWNNDIINAYNAVNNPNVTNFDKDKAFAIGGVRIQSFSDFISTMFFDYVQCISELEAKKLPSHAYTKEADFVKLFGSCGIKTNMSFVYAEHGCREISQKEFDKIRKSKGDAYVTSYKDKGKTHYFEYLYTDLDPQHPQSFDPTEAFRLRVDKRYEDNCGTIAVGVADQHIITLLRDNRIDMVIPYHKSGIDKEVAIMRKINNYDDYTKFQTERDKKTGYLLGDKKKEHIAALKKSGAYGKHFDFYGDLAKTRNPKQTAQNYLKWCKENNLTPKFEKFTGEENYYKLLADFKLYKQDANGNDVYVPQQSVKLKMNDDWQQVLQKALDVNQEVADRFNNSIDDLLKDCKNILEQNAQLLKDSKKKAIKFNKKKGTYSVADPSAVTDYATESSPISINKKSGKVSLNNKRFSIGGVGAKTANVTDLEKAREMLNKGIAANEVWFKTGWYIGKDGQPRFEISDKEYDINNGFKNARIEGNNIVNDAGKKIMMDTEYPINKIIKHDALFKAYPSLEKIGVGLYSDSESKTRGSFDKENNIISINVAKMLNDNGTIDSDKIKSTLIHELQHGIQRIEGFAVGSSLFAEKSVVKSEYGRKHRFTQEELDDVNVKAQDRYRRHYGEGEARVVQRRLDYYKKDKESGEFLRKYGNMPEQDFDYDVNNSIIAHDENFVNQNVRYSLASTKDSKWLENSKKIKVYRAMVLLDGKLYPPMSTKVRGVLRDPVQFGKWYKSDEDQSIITNKKIKKDKKTGEEREIGYIRLEKSNGKNLDDVAYNPYWHASVTMLNDQFTSAWDRPELVVVECEIAEDDINEKYRADFAKDYIGKSKWHSGTVSSRLQKLGRPAREVYLSRYIKALRIVPNAEVAQSIADMVKGTNVAMPENVVTPEVLENLKKLGVKIGKPVGLDADFVEKRRQAKEGSDSNGRRFSKRKINRYDGIDFSKDSSIYDYDFLTKLPDMNVVTLPDVDSVRNNGEVYPKKVIKNAYKNLQNVGFWDPNSKEFYVTNDYTNKDIIITNSSIRHGLNGNLPRLLTNSRLASVIGDIIKSAVPINGLINTADVKSTYAMASYAVDSDGRKFIAISTIEQRENKLDKIEIYDVAHAVSGRQQKDGSLAAYKEAQGFPNTGIALSKLPSKISIADLLENVKSTYQSILSDDVLKHFNEKRNPDGYYSNRVLFSLRNADGSKKTNQQLWFEQQAKFSKLIEEKKAKENAPKTGTPIQRLKENLAYMADRAEYNFTNKRHYLKKWQTDLEESLANDPDYADLFENGRLKDKFDVHMMFDTVDGRVQTKRDNFTEEYWNPIYESVTKNGVKYDDLNRYLFARHAEERDRHVQSINPDFAKEGHGSGWNDDWGTPDEVMKSLEQKYGQQVMQDIGKKFDTLNDKLLDWQVKYHLTSKETADLLRKTYKHYTPLKRFDDYMRAGRDIDTAELNISQNIRAKALGRKSAPEHMLTFVKANIDTVFRRGERNMINLAMLELALKLNDPLMEVNRKLIKRISKDGEVEYVRDMTADAEQTIGVRDGDKYYTIHIGNKEIYNAFVSNDMKNNEIFEALVSSFRGITSTMGANATSRNIEFGLVNLDKDQQQALSENLVYRSKKGDFWNFAKNAIKNIPSAAKTFIKYTMGKDDADTREFKEFLENGGSTGYMDIYKLVDDAKDLEAHIDEATLGFFEKWAKWKRQGKITANMIAKAKEVTGKLLAPLELINNLFEQTTRFANYRTARKFMSAARAAELSKNLTLNFNRHGKMWGSQWNWMYMFSNASLQGTVKTMRMYEKAFSEKATPEQRLAARSILGFAFAAGVMAELLNHAFSPDDDDELKFYDKLDANIKDNNVIIMNPASKTGKNYIKLPLFIGGAFPYMMGRNAAAMMSGTQSIGESVSNVVQNMEDYFSPLGSSAPNKEGKGDIVKRVAPTALRPFLDVSYNSNFAGSRIYAQSMNSNKPAYIRAFKKTPLFYVELSKLLTRMTGGNTLEKGSVDIPPEAIQHIVESYTGGTGKFVGRTVDTARKLVKGEKLDTGNIPIIRRFTDDVGDSYVYDEYRKIQEVYRTVTTAEKDRNKELLEKYPKHRNLVNLMKRYNPRLTRLDKKLERNQIDMDTYRSEYVSILKQINKDGRKYIQQK